MKPILEISQSKGYSCRILLTPDVATVTIPQDTSATRRDQIIAFAEYILEQFVDINETWTGVITFHLDGVTWAKTVLRAGLKNRKYEVVI